MFSHDGDAARSCSAGRTSRDPRATAGEDLHDVMLALLMAVARITVGLWATWVPDRAALLHEINLQLGAVDHAARAFIAERMQADAAEG